MAGVGEMITGRGARQSRSLAEQAQATQRTQLADERRRVDAVAAGQSLNAQRGGGGLLAYIDQAKARGDKLKETFG